jgi:hypothetical protein
MEDIRKVSDEALRRPGPYSLTDYRAAEELGIAVDRMVEIMDTWSRHAGEVARERIRRNKMIASPDRTVVE